MEQPECKALTPEGHLMFRSGKREDVLFAVSRLYHPDGYIETETMCAANPMDGEGKIVVRYYPSNATCLLKAGSDQLPVSVSVLGETVFGGNGRETMGHLFYSEPVGLKKLFTMMSEEVRGGKRHPNRWGSCLVVEECLHILLAIRAFGRIFTIISLRKISLDLDEHDVPLKATFHIQDWH